jgi:hypothetical protein
MIITNINVSYRHCLHLERAGLKVHRADQWSRIGRDQHMLMCEGFSSKWPNEGYLELFFLLFFVPLRRNCTQTKQHIQIYHPQRGQMVSAHQLCTNHNGNVTNVITAWHSGHLWHIFHQHSLPLIEVGYLRRQHHSHLSKNEDLQVVETSDI